MNRSLLLILIATLGLGCSNQDNAGPEESGAYAGAQNGWSGQTGSGGQNAGAGQPAQGGEPSIGGHTGSGGHADIGGQLGAGGSTSGGTTGISTGGTVGQSATSGSGGLGLGGLSGAGAISSAGGNAAAGGIGGSLATGGARANDAGSGGASSTYRPCPADGTACKILPLGDSITWGVGDEGNAGYRGPLFALTVAAQQKITFTGSLSNGPDMVSGQPFPKRNEGHSGWGISTVTQYSNGVAGIATVIPNPALTSSSGGMPNIVLLMIGTNDTGSSTAAAMADRLSALMDKITAAAPDALLVVAKITPVSWANGVINAYNDALPSLVQMRAAAGKHVLLADMNAGFTSAMIGSDGIHPNNMGYKFMADRWYSVIGSLLPK